MIRQALNGEVFKLQEVGAPYRVVALAAMCSALSEVRTGIRHRNLQAVGFWGARVFLALRRVIFGKRGAGAV